MKQAIERLTGVCMIPVSALMLSLGIVSVASAEADVCEGNGYSMTVGDGLVLQRKDDQA